MTTHLTGCIGHTTSKQTRFVIAQGSFEDVRHFTTSSRWAKPGNPKVRFFDSAASADVCAESMPMAPVGGWRVVEVSATGQP